MLSETRKVWQQISVWGKRYSVGVVLGLLAVALVALAERLEYRVGHWLEVVVYLGLGVGLGLWLSRWRRVWRAREEHWQQRAHLAERQVVETHQHLSQIFRLSHKLADAVTEEEVIDLTLRLAVDTLGLPGAAFVPLDDRGRPLAARVQAQQPLPGLDAWAEHLASPEVRQACASCRAGQGRGVTCPVLVQSPFRQFNPEVQALCWPVRRGWRELGMLVLCLEEGRRLSEEQQALIRLAIEETGVALEGVRARRRELQALADFPLLARRPDWGERLPALLEQVARALEAECAYLLWQDAQGRRHTWAWQAEEQAPLHRFLETVALGVMQSGQPIVIGDVRSDPPSRPGSHAVLAVPMLGAEGQTVGALAVLRTRRAFQPRQTVVLRTMAAQLALLLQAGPDFAQRMHWLLEERRRLAREIHDGLAQTLGYLKLRAAQMGQWLRRGDYERLQHEWEAFYRTLGDAYKEVRQAIDGLRINPLEHDLNGWLNTVAQSFHEQTGIAVEIVADEAVRLPPEWQVQLIRVLQEALSNVWKHAQAQQVWIRLYRQHGDVMLEIEDDGQGFEYDAVPLVAHHGLEGMRERVELLGGDFQVRSRPGEGTLVRVQLPDPVEQVGRTPPKEELS